MPYKPREKCKHCEALVKSTQTVFCSQACQIANKRETYLARWKLGVEKGYGAYGQLSNTIREYLLSRAEGKCEECGWSEVHPITGKIPVEIHHKDGHYDNTKEDNLIVLCPNCHSLTSNHGSRNRGKGRPYTRIAKTVP